MSEWPFYVTSQFTWEVFDVGQTRTYSRRRYLAEYVRLVYSLLVSRLVSPLFTVDRPLKSSSSSSKRASPLCQTLCRTVGAAGAFRLSRTRGNTHLLLAVYLVVGIKTRTSGPRWASTTIISLSVSLSFFIRPCWSIKSWSSWWQCSFVSRFRLVKSIGWLEYWVRERERPTRKRRRNARQKPPW